MQIVIDIDTVDYEYIKNGCIIPIKIDNHIYDAICKGTPLHKGHGKIIDVKDLLDRICLDDTDENREDNVGEIITLEDIDSIPTIIEADKEK